MIDLELSGVIWGGVVEQSGAIGSNRELMQSDKGFDKGSDKGGERQGAQMELEVSLIARIGTDWCGLVSEFCFC